MIYLVGMGPGGRDYLTPLAEKTIAKADKVYSFPKHREMLGIDQERWESLEGGRLARLPRELSGMDGELAVLVSGDPRVFSLSRRFFTLLPKERLRLIPGIGSDQILGCALGLQSPLPQSVSLHGHPIKNLKPALYRNEGLFIYTDRICNPRAIAGYMDGFGFSDWRIVVGSDLGTEEQSIQEFTVQSILKERDDREWGLNLVYSEPLPRDRTNAGCLYGIGIGPGDPELMTQKALRVLRESDLILTPHAEGRESSLARDIIEQIAGAELPIENMPYPVTKDQKQLNQFWDRMADHCAEVLKDGQNISYVTLGDPSLYSTFSHLLFAMERKHPELPWEIIPGISSFQMAAGRFGLPLAMKKESCAIVPCPDDPEELLPLIEAHESLVVMKIGKRLPSLKRFLKNCDLEESAAYISRAGMSEEYISKNLKELDDAADGALAIVMIRGRNKK